MDYRERISIDPERRSGKPCVKGTRMTVAGVLEYLASGMTQADILEEFPYHTEEDIPACRGFAERGEA